MGNIVSIEIIDNRFTYCSQEEQEDINGGGLVSGIVGGVLGACVGVIVGGIVMTTTDNYDFSIMAKGAVVGGLVGGAIGGAIPTL